MCQSLAEGGRRCGKTGPGHSLTDPAMTRALEAFEPVGPDVSGAPDMPADWQPRRPWWRTSPLSESERRLFWYREHGYAGPLNQDGRPCRGMGDMS
jgi:hypothetical protein